MSRYSCPGSGSQQDGISSDRFWKDSKKLSTFAEVSLQQAVFEVHFAIGKPVHVAEHNAEAQDEHVQRACFFGLPAPDINMAQNAGQPDGNGR